MAADTTEKASHRLNTGSSRDNNSDLALFEALKPYLGHCLTLNHDLNNPLAVVMGQLEMIAEFHPELPDDMKHRLGELSTAAETMRRVIMEAAKEARRAMGEKG